MAPQILVNWYLAEKSVANWELGTPISTLLYTSIIYHRVYITFTNFAVNFVYLGKEYYSVVATHLSTEMVFLANVSSFLMYGPISWNNFENTSLESLKLATNSASGISLKSRSNHSVDLLLPVFLRLLLNFSKKALFFIILRQMTVFDHKTRLPHFY